MKKVNPGFIALLTISSVFGWLVLSFAIATHCVEHGIALDEQQRWIEPFVGQYAGFSLYGLAIVGLLLVGWWTRTITAGFGIQRARKNVNARIRNILRLSRTDDELLANLAKVGITFDARTCIIPAEYWAHGSNRCLSRLLLALLRIHAKNIIDLLERIERFEDPSDTVFHGIARQFVGKHTDDVNAIIRTIKQEHELFGVAMEKAVKYITAQRKIDVLLAEQSEYVFNFADEHAAVDQLIADSIGEPSIQRRKAISWTKALIMRLPSHKTAPVRTAA